MKRGDLMMIAAILLAAAVLALFSGRESGSPTAVVTIAGERAAVIPLSGSSVWLAPDMEGHSVEMTAPGEYLIRTEAGENLLQVSPDGAIVLWADCASQDCVHTGRISRPGRVIACLPHRVIVTLEGLSREGDVDAIA